MSITESSSPYQDLEKLALGEVLEGINREDQKVALAVSKKLDQITSLIEQVVVRMKSGGSNLLYRSRNQWSFGYPRRFRMSTHLRRGP